MLQLALGSGQVSLGTWRMQPLTFTCCPANAGILRRAWVWVFVVVVITVDLGSEVVFREDATIRYIPLHFIDHRFAPVDAPCRGLTLRHVCDPIITPFGAIRFSQDDVHGSGSSSARRSGSH